MKSCVNLSNANPALYDYIDSLTVKVQHLCLEVLDLKGNYITAIEGLATSGSISINGSSAVRRTGSLNLTVGKESTLNRITDINNAISLNKKVRVLIGIENTGRQFKEYDIFWFSLGVFLIKAASVQNNVSGITMSVSLTDQMGYLNGELGGVILGAVTHSPLKIEGSDSEEPVEIYTLIRTLVQQYSGLPNDKIKIFIPSGDSKKPWVEEGTAYKITASWRGSDTIYLGPEAEGSNKYILSKTPFKDATPYGQYENIGYKMDKLTYSGELASKPGDTVVSVLDKIKGALGNYEYFFDLEGNFIFQEIQNGLYSGGIPAEDFTLGAAINSSYLNGDSTIVKYELDKKKGLISSYSNTPAYNNVKNDFVVWGKSKSSDGLPIRYHLRYMKLKEIQLHYYSVGLYVDDFGVRRASWARLSNETEVSAIKARDWRQELYFQFIAENDQSMLAKEMIEEFPKVYDISFDSNTGTGWKYNVSYDNVKYYLDAIDVSEIDESIPIHDFAIEDIGLRSKVLNDNDVNVIFAKMPKDVVFIGEGEEPPKGNYAIVSQDLENNIKKETTIKSAYSVIQSTLYNYICYNNSISITALPMFYLEPNVGISIEDEESDIHGVYIIQNLSLPLGVDGTMSISATKALKSL